MLDDVKKNILAELRRDTNGAVVGTMFEMLGSEKYINYGVTIPFIKKVAREYCPNHFLAMDMFVSQIRELKLCAVYVDTPSEVTIEQMESWSDSFDSVEVMEHCCTMLFYGASDTLLVAEGWMTKFPYAALLMTAKRAKIMFKEEERERYVAILNAALTVDDSVLNFKGKCQLLTALSNSDNKMRRYISLLPLSERILEEICWQIEKFNA